MTTITRNVIEGRSMAREILGGDMAEQKAQTTLQPVISDEQYLYAKQRSEELRDQLIRHDLAVLMSLVPQGKQVKPVYDANGFEF